MAAPSGTMRGMFQHYSSSPAVRAFVVTYIGYATLYSTRKPFSVVKSHMQADLGLSTFTLGSIDTAFLLAYAVGQLILPRLFDSWGMRKPLFFCYALSGTCAIIFSVASEPQILTLAWLVNGVAHASVFPLLIKALAGRLSPKHRGRALGLWTTSQQTGAMVATAFAAYVADRMGWRGAFALPGVACLLAGAMLYTMLSDCPGHMTTAVAPTGAAAEEKSEGKDTAGKWDGALPRRTAKGSDERSITPPGSSPPPLALTPQEPTKYTDPPEDCAGTSSFEGSLISFSSAVRGSCAATSSVRHPPCLTAGTPVESSTVGSAAGDSCASADGSAVAIASRMGRAGASPGPAASQAKPPPAVSPTVVRPRSLLVSLVLMFASPLHLIIRALRPSPPPPPGASRPPAAPISPRPGTTPLTYWQVVRIPLLANAAGAYFCVKLIRYSLLFWLPYFLSKQLNYAPEIAGYTSMAFDLGGVAGALVTGYISDHTLQGRRLTAAALMSLCSGFSLLLFAWASHFGIVLTILFMALVGFSIAGPDSVLGAAAAQDICEKAGHQLAAAHTHTGPS
eukprot:GHVT01016307.1.p1 GENE.GHVT01016307.1~~GHVT01016307.1.p1  ORF type:complete len:565 (+),score=96.74 GHVT01016307.1:4451-6145(+)